MGVKLWLNPTLASTNRDPLGRQSVPVRKGAWTVPYSAYGSTIKITYTFSTSLNTSQSRYLNGGRKEG